MSLAAAAKKAVSRRGFLRAMPAAPLAAPSIAKEIANSVAGPQPGYGAIGYAGQFSNDAAPSVDMGYMRDRRRHLEDVIAGKSDDQNQPLIDHRTSAYHYDGLRSVSPVMRSQLYARDIQRRELEQRKHWARIELKDLMKRFFA